MRVHPCVISLNYQIIFDNNISKFTSGVFRLMNNQKTNTLERLLLRVQRELTRVISGRCADTQVRYPQSHREETYET